MATAGLIAALMRLQRTSPNPVLCVAAAHGPMEAAAAGEGEVRWRCAVCGHEETVAMTLIRLAELGLI